MCVLVWVCLCVCVTRTSNAPENPNFPVFHIQSVSFSMSVVHFIGAFITVYTQNKNGIVVFFFFFLFGCCCCCCGVCACVFFIVIIFLFLLQQHSFRVLSQLYYKCICMRICAHARAHRSRFDFFIGLFSLLSLLLMMLLLLLLL